MKRFAMGETGNPYRFDSDDKGGIKFFAFNAKKVLIFDSGYPIFLDVGRKCLTGAIIKSSYETRYYIALHFNHKTGKVARTL